MSEPRRRPPPPPLPPMLRLHAPRVPSTGDVSGAGRAGEGGGGRTGSVDRDRGGRSSSAVEEAFHPPRPSPPQPQAAKPRIEARMATVDSRDEGGEQGTAVKVGSAVQKDGDKSFHRHARKPPPVPPNDKDKAAPSAATAHSQNAGRGEVGVGKGTPAAEDAGEGPPPREARYSSHNSPHQPPNEPPDSNSKDGAAASSSVPSDAAPSTTKEYLHKEGGCAEKEVSAKYVAAVGKSPEHGAHHSPHKPPNHEGKGKDSSEALASTPSPHPTPSAAKGKGRKEGGGEGKGAEKDAAGDETRGKSPNSEAPDEVEDKGKNGAPALEATARESSQKVSNVDGCVEDEGKDKDNEAALPGSVRANAKVKNQGKENDKEDDKDNAANSDVSPSPDRPSYPRTAIKRPRNAVSALLYAQRMREREESARRKGRGVAHEGDVEAGKEGGKGAGKEVGEEGENDRGEGAKSAPSGQGRHARMKHTPRVPGDIPPRAARGEKAGGSLPGRKRARPVRASRSRSRPVAATADLKSPPEEATAVAKPAAAGRKAPPDDELPSRRSRRGASATRSEPTEVPLKSARSSAEPSRRSWRKRVGGGSAGDHDKGGGHSGDGDGDSKGKGNGGRRSKRSRKPSPASAEALSDATDADPAPEEALSNPEPARRSKRKRLGEGPARVPDDGEAHGDSGNDGVAIGSRRSKRARKPSPMAADALSNALAVAAVSASRSIARSKRARMRPSRDTFEVGDRVEAKYKGKGRRYYPGTVVGAQQLEGRYDVDYDDGDVDRGLSGAFVRRLVGPIELVDVEVSSDDDEDEDAEESDDDVESEDDVKRKGKKSAARRVGGGRRRRLPGGTPRFAATASVKSMATWAERVALLKEHKALYGSCDLALAPSKDDVDKRLKSFVLETRKQYNRALRRKTTTLTAERVAELKEMGFDFCPLLSGSAKARQDLRFQKMWDVMFAELERYKEEHGDCLVSCAAKVYSKLANWVRGQRKHMNKVGREGFNPERLARLEAIGFDFDPVSSGSFLAKKRAAYFPRVEANWERHYGDLLRYREENGTIVVSPKDKKWPGLYDWIHMQRKEYKKWREGDPKALMFESWVAKLNAVGFDWAPMSGAGFSKMINERSSDKYDTLWSKHYE
ncbi:hypothetical protein ACHAWF_008207 [Thalassiosira exigua]